MQDSEIIKLIEQAGNRDPDAFAGLMELYMKDMYKTAIAILQNDEDAADAIQDTLLVCWEKLNTLRKKEFFKTWLIRILINKCYDIRNKYVSTASLETCAEPYKNDEYNLELKEAVASVGEKYSIVLMLYYGLGYSSKEISQILGLKSGTVRARLKRAREKLKDYYDKSELQKI